MEGGAAGIVAAVLLSIFALSRNLIYDGVFKWRLKKSLRWLSVGSGISGVTIGVPNKVGRSFVVRELTLLSENMSFRLNPTGNLETCCDQINPKLTRRQKKMLKAGEIDKVQIRSVMGHQYRADTPPTNGFVTIDPFTSHSFVLPASYATGVPESLKGLEVIIEYRGAGADAKIMSHIVTGSNDLISGTISSLAKQIESGTFDEARRKFGMPPVTPLMKAQPKEKNPNAG